MIFGLTILHGFVSFFLIIVVLLQFGKGAELGAMMGSGSSQSILSSGQQGNILSKATTFFAVVFLVNSVALSVLSARRTDQSIFDDEAPIARPLNNDQAKKEAKAGDKKPVAAKKETQKKTK